jgi:hypothetical protein
MGYIVFSLLVFFVVVCHAFEYGCTHRSANGEFYDLSLLSKCDTSGYIVNSIDGDFFVNICNTVSGACSNSAVCQSSQFNCGTPSSTSLSDAPSGQGVILKYTGGDGCPNGASRSSVFHFNCSTSANDPEFMFLSEQPQCTYNFLVNTKEACPKQPAPQKQLCLVNVFLVPHTHDDVGWLMTIEGYYQSQVKHIIDTSLAAMLANPSRKFIYVEQAYFTLWWNDPNTSDQQRAQMKQVVSEGRREFV